MFLSLPKIEESTAIFRVVPGSSLVLPEHHSMGKTFVAEGHFHLHVQDIEGGTELARHEIKLSMLISTPSLFLNFSPR